MGSPKDFIPPHRPPIWLLPSIKLKEAKPSQKFGMTRIAQVEFSQKEIKLGLGQEGEGREIPGWSEHASFFFLLIRWAVMGRRKQGFLDDAQSMPSGTGKAKGREARPGKAMQRQGAVNSGAIDSLGISALGPLDFD